LEDLRHIEASLAGHGVTLSLRGARLKFLPHQWVPYCGSNPRLREIGGDSLSTHAAVPPDAMGRTQEEQGGHDGRPPEVCRVGAGRGPSRRTATTRRYPRQQSGHAVRSMPVTRTAGG
jgi:hypothetical protein